MALLFRFGIKRFRLSDVKQNIYTDLHLSEAVKTL